VPLSACGPALWSATNCGSIAGQRWHAAAGGWPEHLGRLGGGVAKPWTCCAVKCVCMRPAMRVECSHLGRLGRRVFMITEAPPRGLRPPPIPHAGIWRVSGHPLPGLPVRNLLDLHGIMCVQCAGVVAHNTPVLTTIPAKHLMKTCPNLNCCPLPQLLSSRLPSRLVLSFF
jgi:hypothetical protein